jgi:hypothetical protein
MLSESFDRIDSSDATIPIEIEEIDEALQYASESRNKSDYSQHQREIVDNFIDDLLDTRLELKRC